MRSDLVRKSVITREENHTCLLAGLSHIEHKGAPGFGNLEQMIKSRGTLIKGCLNDLTREDMALCIIILSDMPLSTSECEAVLYNLKRGGGILILLNECLDETVLSSANYLLESLSISANSDSVVGTSGWGEFLHPKEAMITTDWCTLVYPYGCTLNSIPPAVPLIGTGKNCYPYHRPILATSNVGTGRVCVVGSSQMLNDRYMKMKENAFLLESIVDFLLEGRIIDFPMPKISDYRFMPCLSELAEGPFYCWKPLLEPLPDDITTLASMELYDCGLRYYDEVMHAFEQLGLDPSSQMSGMIKPAYRIEPFRLIPALPLPSFGSLLDPPELELVDFDDMMESSQVRLTRLANRCSESDIEQFLQEGAGIVGFNCESENPFDILDLIAHKLLFE